MTAGRESGRDSPPRATSDSWRLPVLVILGFAVVFVLTTLVILLFTAGPQLRRLWEG